MAGIIATVLTAVWIMLPAYIPNNAAVLVGGGPPIDAGKTWRGKRILGDGKTWRGSIGGVLAGLLLSQVLNYLLESVEIISDYGFPSFPFLAGFCLALGAILGDMTASFIKRRTGRERGASFPGVDQLDFVVGSFVVTAIGASDWFFSNFTLPVIFVVLVVTPALHIITNIIAYKLGLKDEPW